MKKKASITLLLIILLALLLSGCNVLDTLTPEPTAAAEPGTAVPTTAAPTTPADPVSGLATVESLEILTLESFPVQIHVRVAGTLPNECTEIDEISGRRENNAFTVSVSTLQESTEACSDAAVPFEQIVPLDVVGLPAGSYTVSVNDVSGSFNLDMDNVMQEEPAAETAEQIDGSSDVAFTASGRVWHDVCAGDAAGDEAPAGCVAVAEGGFVADGVLNDEPGIAGVRVNLAQGACPSNAGILTATTDDEGVFSFGNLRASEYCISVDTEDEINQALLLPGSWTAPAGGAVEAAVLLSVEEPGQEVNFGWDYELLPVDQADCSNSFELLEDLNIPDDTVMPPAQEFTKKWRLRNNGSCPWNSDYSILFVGGDQMGAEESIPLEQTVAVSQTMDVAVDMAAPDEAGTYRGNWQIAGPDGEPFGIDGNIEDAFWLRIVVEEEEGAPKPTPAPGSGSIGGVVWDDYCINSSPARGCVEAGENSGVFVADGSFDVFESSLSDITITLAKNACPGDGTLPAASVILETAVTDADGLYLFEGLSTGTYCIFMDALSEENVDQLIPGNWTWPGTGVGKYTFILDPGEQALDLDFGWDYVE